MSDNNEIIEKIKQLALNQDIEGLKQLAAQGVSFNHLDPYGESLLSEIAWLLCDSIDKNREYTIHPNDLPHEQFLALVDQYKPLRYQVVQTLLDLGADPNLGLPEESVLASPMLAMDGEMLRILLEAGADPNGLCDKDEPTQTLLDWADMDYCFETNDYPWDPQTNVDRQNFDNRLDYLERMAAKYNYTPPIALRVLRQYGAKTYEEMHPKAQD